MLMIKETKFTQDELEKYFNRGYRCAVSDGKHFPKVSAREPVSFILTESKLYSINIKEIEYLIHTKHTVNIKLGNKVWTHVLPEDWKHTYKIKDKFHTDKHPVLELYELKRDDYLEKQALEKAQTHYRYIVDTLYPNGIPDDSELEVFIETWKQAYDIQVDYNDKADVLLKYATLKYYLDNNLDVSNRDTEPDILYVGDGTYFEDLIYKNSDEELI